MKLGDRERLEAIRFTPEVVARTEEVLRVWGVEDLFAECSYCGKPSLNRDLPRGMSLPKKHPADLFLRRELVGFREGGGEVICWPSDDFQFEFA